MIKIISSEEIDCKNLSEHAARIAALRDVEYKGCVLTRLNINIDEFASAYKELVSRGIITKYIEQQG